MVNVLHNFINHMDYAGRSYDPKPTDCGTGSRFTEVDTGKEYVFDSISKEWNVVGGGNPTSHTYSLKTDVPEDFSYDAGDNFDPTDFTYYIADEGGNVVDTLTSDFISALQLVNDGDGDKFMMTASGTAPAFWCGLLDENEEWADLTEMTAGTYKLAAVAYKGGSAVIIPANWLVNGTEGLTLTTTYDMSDDVTVNEGT